MTHSGVLSRTRDGPSPCARRYSPQRSQLQEPSRHRVLPSGVSTYTRARSLQGDRRSQAVWLACAHMTPLNTAPRQDTEVKCKGRGAAEGRSRQTDRQADGRTDGHTHRANLQPHLRYRLIRRNTFGYSDVENEAAILVFLLEYSNVHHIA